MENFRNKALIMNQNLKKNQVLIFLNYIKKDLISRVFFNKILFLKNLNFYLLKILYNISPAKDKKEAYTAILLRNCNMRIIELILVYFTPFGMVSLFI